MRVLLVMAAVVCSSACVSLGTDPLLVSMTATPSPIGCRETTVRVDGHGQSTTVARAIPEGDQRLCTALSSVTQSAASLHASATELDRTQAGLGATQLSAAIATLGFLAFDAHPDNALASTLIGGSALAARNGLRPQARRDVLRAGLRAYNCTIERGSVFIGAAGRADALEERANGSANAALMIRSLAPTGDADKSARLATALEALATAIANGRAALGPMRNADAQVNDTRRLIEQTMERKLSELQPDYTAIAAAIGDLAPQAEDAGAGEAGGAGAAGGGGRPPSSSPVDRLESILRGLGVDIQLRRVGSGANARVNIDDLIALTNELAQRMASDTGPGQAQYSAIAECAALA